MHLKSSKRHYLIDKIMVKQNKTEQTYIVSHGKHYYTLHITHYYIIIFFHWNCCNYYYYFTENSINKLKVFILLLLLLLSLLLLSLFHRNYCNYHYYFAGNSIKKLKRFNVFKRSHAKRDLIAKIKLFSILSYCLMDSKRY